MTKIRNLLRYSVAGTFFVCVYSYTLPVSWSGEADPLLPPPKPKDEQLLPPGPVAPRPALPKASAPVLIPVPGDDFIIGAKQIIKDTYKDEYRARRQEDKIAFGHTLLAAGLAPTDNPDLRFALLRESGDVAAKNGDFDTAEASLDALVKYYSININEESARVYESLVANITNTETGQRLALALVGLIENCIIADNYTLAQSLSKSGETLGRRIRDNGMVARAKFLGNKAKKLNAEFVTLADYQDLLGQMSPEGHRRMGLFLCIGKNDWTKGVTHLAQGDEQLLKEVGVLDYLAQTSLGKDEKIGTQTFAAAEKIYTVAASQSRGDPREAFQARSLLWYRRSLNALEASDRSTCEKRIDELSKLLANSPYNVSVNYPPGAVLLLTFEPESLMVSGNNITGVLDTSLFGLRATASGVKPVRGAFGTALEFDGTGRIDCGNPKQLQIGGDLTISMWLWARVLNERRNPFNKSYGGEGTITMETSGTLNYFYGINGNDGGTYTSAEMHIAIQPQTWLHFTLVRDLTTERKLTWYRNGKQTNSTSAAYPKTVTSTQPLIIGDGYTNPFIGKMDDVCIWPRALSADEVASLHEATAIGR